jgi:hypothetical protein
MAYPWHINMVSKRPHHTAVRILKTQNQKLLHLAQAEKRPKTEEIYFLVERRLAELDSIKVTSKK